MTEPAKSLIKEQALSFGDIVVQARQRIGLSQKHLAAQLRKEDGSPISAQYLHDIEKGRRNPPPPPLLDQLAQALNLPPDYLYYAAGELPQDLREAGLGPEQVHKVFGALRDELKSGHKT
jgi:transcriptional regulator with XRE-family HTH domain